MKSTVIVFCLASMLFLCSCNANTEKYTTESETALTTLCTNDEGFVEPTVKVGRYYLNGDTSSYYINVTETTVEFCDVDLSAVYDSWQPQRSEDYVPTEFDIEVKEECLERWEGVKPYHVKTLHEYNDNTVLVTHEETTPDGLVLSSGLILKDENTITGFGKDGDFILVE